MNGKNEYLLKDITFIKGVGEAKAKLLNRLGIFTLYDMLMFFPRYVESRGEIKHISELHDGETACISAEIYSPVTTAYIRKNMQIYSVTVRDGYDVATMKWFNNKYVKGAFKIGEKFNFYGKAERKFGKVTMTSPTYEREGQNLHTGRVVPVYPLTENLPQKTIRMIAKNCVDITKGCIKEYLPPVVREKYRLCEINWAISSIHFPETVEDYETARRRLAFEELLFMQLGLFKLRNTQKRGGAPIIDGEKYVGAFLEKIPFCLTKAQSTVLGELLADMKKSVPMSRLIQGDVGSGKTVVAFAAMYCAVRSGVQTALMAPTGVLAGQHYEGALKYFDESEVVLLTGATKAAEKRKILEKIADGRAKVIIGTHALFEDNVEFKNLGLVITDEQHRFGVLQRAAIAGKGKAPHTVVMSATPIPRTLALILYGDLDISVIGELPPGRKTVDTFAATENMRPRIEKFMRKEIENGRQVFVVCPLVGDSDKLDLESAERLYTRLKEKVFPDKRVALLHGKMKPSEKTAVMEAFAAGETDILVSTTVIEVGINVPNASVMIIENAERFGLSTLHQLRGRVGRGSDKAYCIMIADNLSEMTKKRLGVMCETNDGFVIARKDLELRGPGDLLGTRQHGLPDLKIANLAADGKILKEANTCMREIMAADRELKLPENEGLKAKVNEMFKLVVSG